MAAIGTVIIMHILDTDHLSLIRRNGPDGQRILANLDAHEDIEVATTVITFEEQTRGRLALLGRAKTIDQIVLATTGCDNWLAIISPLPYLHLIMQPR
jgi:tRNA(fMet)-specific endonuclease VapC